jgi:hypothetical protein
MWRDEAAVAIQVLQSSKRVENDVSTCNSISGYQGAPQTTPGMVYAV